MAQLVKTTCSRCNGSGRFSFNLVRGTVCFGCEGVGTKMVDPAKVKAAAKVKAKRAEQRAALDAERQKFRAIVVEKIQADFGPFEDTEKGWYELDMACRRANDGKSVGEVANAMRLTVAA